MRRKSLINMKSGEQELDEREAALDALESRIKSQKNTNLTYLSVKL